MVFARHLAVATLALAFAAAGGARSLADPPAGHGHGPPIVLPGVVRPHALVVGKVLRVDYGSATILVGSGHSRIPVAVTPSTSIFRDGGFASFSDIGPGSHVQIDVSDFGGRLVAQIIRIL